MWQDRGSICGFNGFRRGRSAVFAGVIAIDQTENLRALLRAAVELGGYEPGVDNYDGYDSGDEQCG